MFDDECVPEPLSIILNVVVYPFLSSKSQGTERVQRSDVVDENVRCGWLLCCQGILLLRDDPPHLPWKATTVEIDTLTPRLVSTVAIDGLLLMLSKFY